MLARLADEIPGADNFLFEPKWDGFRAIVFRGQADVFIQSRDRRPLDRYFPELHDALLERLPDGADHMHTPQMERRALLDVTHAYDLDRVLSSGTRDSERESLY